MAHSNHSSSAPRGDILSLALPTCTLEQQARRQRLSDEWEPQGFARYQYQRALLQEMNVLGGMTDQYGANPDRYLPPPSLD